MTPWEQEQYNASCFSCLVKVVLVVTMIVLIVGSIVGYEMLHHKDSHSSGPLKEQTITLTGPEYAAVQA